MDVKAYMREAGQQARSAAQQMAKADTGAKNHALHSIASMLLKQQQHLMEKNSLDLSAGREKGLDNAMLERLELNPDRIKAMADGLEQIAKLADPIGEISQMARRPTGIEVGQMRVPLGVVGIIYESRPNVTADAAALCIKSGNACLLRGGSEALNSNQAIASCISAGLEEAGLPATAVQVIETDDRAAVGEMLGMPEYVDVIIPRGGKSLIERVSAEARMPVIKHLDGLCHVYVDDPADLEKAVAIAYNAKTNRYGVCNAMECLLLHEQVAEPVLEILLPKYQEAGVEIRGCEITCGISDKVVAATEEDFYTEYLAPILSVKVVKGLDYAIQHINHYGSQHTDAIVTENLEHARRFLREVDSSSVMVNASTRFADGYEFGLGAEIGISTDKFHARGPVGLEGLTSQKYIVMGDGQIRE